MTRDRRMTGRAPRHAAMAPVGWLARHRRALARRCSGATGIGGMAAFFLLPNMLIFGIFVLLPLVINFVYSMTGGTALFLGDRTFVGAEQYARLLRLRQLSRPEDLRRGPVLDRGLQHRPASSSCRSR